MGRLIRDILEDSAKNFAPIKAKVAEKEGNL